MTIAETLIKSTEAPHQPYQYQAKPIRLSPYWELPNSPICRCWFAKKPPNHALIEKLTDENQYLHNQVERLEGRMASEIKRSDAMIDQMQTAAEESSKRAQTIIMHLSQQVERQAEQIEILQELQGFGGAIRQTVKHLKSRILRQPLAAGQKYGYEA